ncbi:Proteolipid membrane potential modulator family-containing protein [Strongyloides ratti]|uniref:Proteolipid membrane potential modulator family-containing protein n=1 Tax=Strongyloides ratti TaxID=34506 RepID=A0A090LMW8_STRRB|nr:Proteolipid membrane potential modulator family-containing protein [Strongyloides ratti]CEF69513.1 Proteolipid membrane potential modulator family-containing protein [Strongyloides ratti]
MVSEETKEVFLILLVIIIPPLAVWIKDGCGAQVILNIFLSLLGALPGIVHAAWIYKNFIKINGYFSNVLHIY